MLLKFKKALSSAAQGLGTFKTLDIEELEKFAQNYNFNQPLIRLEPITGGLGSIDIGGVVLDLRRIEFIEANNINLKSGKIITYCENGVEMSVKEITALWKEAVKG